MFITRSATRMAKLANSGKWYVVHKLSLLLESIQACRICAPELPHEPRPVVQLHADARILIAGQAPGRKVHSTGVPFDDVSGDRLREWMGIDRDTFYDPRLMAILPMGFCFPGKGPSGDLPPRRECAGAWRNEVLSCLQKVELMLVIGRYAQAWHLKTGKAIVSDVVRNWRNWWPDRMPLPHPSPRNRNWIRLHPWFDGEVLPALRSRIASILGRR